jgi:hypothetical protein
MGFYEVAKVLLENEANVNALTSDNERPIDLVDNGNIELISLLLTYINRVNSLEEYMTKSVLSIFETHAQPQSTGSDSDKETAIVNEIKKFLNNDANFMTSVTFVKALASAVFQFNFLNCSNQQLKSMQHVKVLRKFALSVSSSTVREMEMECLKALVEFVNRFQVSPGASFFISFILINE